MIDRIQGLVLEKEPTYLVVMVGGVGLRVNITKTVLDRLEGTQANLYTYLVVREDALTLFGFADAEEREVFEVLLKVNGVGPRLAVAILSTLTIDQLRNAVSRETPEILTRVPGVGKKTAQKIVLELKDKIGWKLGLDAVPVVTSDVDSDVLATLAALGYSIVEAQSAVQAIPKNAPQDVEERVRLALEYFI